MTGGEEQDEKTSKTRCSNKSHISFNNYPTWKHKLRENCYKRVRADRTQLLWKMRLSDSKDHAPVHKELIKSTFQDIVSDEFRKIKETPVKDSSETSDDMLWEYDGIHDAYQGECEEILLEMQKIFYEDLHNEQIGKESDNYMKLWEDEEDEYLAHAVFENMQLSDDKVTLEFLRNRLAEVHGQHYDRGCKLRPKFCIKSRFDLTAMYIECEGCSTFEVVI
uniref:uncharacterized protein LOC122608236 isoform X2 n=1 Tax=Erigeron canadensis TaxID=72917 RepID=UPI001CB944A2|nr:uncharacterized protein LOC122608236 isoform X2 [Erigeron canadensis]